MPTAMIEAHFTPDLKDVVREVPRIGRELIRLLEGGVEEIARHMAAELRATTPRSEHADAFLQAAGIGPDDGHVADGWKTRRVDDEYGAFAVEVYNDHPRANADIDYSGGTTTLLHILEYGTRPHIIRARPGKRLVFFWPAIDQIVNAVEVEHPGTKPYGMMAMATVGAVDRATKLLNAAATVAQQLLGGAV